MDLAEISRETLAILDRGGYRSPGGQDVAIGSAVSAAVAGARLVRPGDLGPAAGALAGRGRGEPRIEVTGETSAEAASRLRCEAPGARTGLLNFASAKNPGGGFLGRAKAQEEDLARASALYPCLLSQPAYYEVNRACGSPLYTDHLIYSPGVPFFRSPGLYLLEEPFLVDVITAPAPNAGEALRRDPSAGPAIREALERRAGLVLALAARESIGQLVLGAWGCGVFRNSPIEVAEVFGGWLEGPFRSAFDRIVFAVYDRSQGQQNRRAFDERFGARPRL